jgi:hypothetical protein
MIKQPMALAILAVFAAVAILIIAIIAAHGSPSCMTRAEARAQFPRAHLYWHTLHHCWDNQAGGRARTRKADRLPIRDATVNTCQRSSPADTGVSGLADCRDRKSRKTVDLLAAVHWYPRGFDAVAALEPPVIITVIDHRWPGSNVIDAPILIIEPMTVVAAQQFNEMDEQVR